MITRRMSVWDRMERFIFTPARWLPKTFVSNSFLLVRRVGLIPKCGQSVSDAISGFLKCNLCERSPGSCEIWMVIGVEWWSLLQYVE